MNVGWERDFTVCFNPFGERNIGFVPGESDFKRALDGFPVFRFDVDNPVIPDKKLNSLS